MKKRMTWIAVLAAALLLTGCGDANRDTSRTMEPGNVWDSRTESDNRGSRSEEEYQKMLENGRVRDRDGNLADGENSHW